MVVPVVGLTGGIASGKSTVARAFAAEGIPVIDADQLAREVVAPGSEGLSELVDAFGADILAPDGSLDRKVLGARVFQSDELRRQLNAITHPRIGRLSAERIAAIDATAPYAVYEAALLVENGLHKNMRALVVVALDEARQLERILLRDQLSEGEARARIAAQAPLAHKLAVADYVIENSGELDALCARVSDVHRALLQRFGRAP
jgi:dephospho-CoA kinase